MGDGQAAASWQRGARRLAGTTAPGRSGGPVAPSDEHIRSSRWLSLGVRDLNCTRVGLGLRTRLVAPLSGVGIRPCVLERHSLHAQRATRPGPGHGRKGAGAPPPPPNQSDSSGEAAGAERARAAGKGGGGGRTRSISDRPGEFPVLPRPAGYTGGFQVSASARRLHGPKASGSHPQLERQLARLGRVEGTELHPETARNQS